MSFLNGLGSLGSGLSNFAASGIKDAEEQQKSASLINAAPPVTAPAVTTPAPVVASPGTPATATPTASGGNDVIDDATLGRAHLVYQGLVQRGMDPNTALGFAANAIQESAANPGTGAGDMGASHGLLQWRGDRLAAYEAKFGHAPEKGSLDEQLDFITHELGGTESAAAKAIQASADDPASRAGAVSAFYERPKDTAAEIRRRGFLANQLAGRIAQLNSTTGAG